MTRRQCPAARMLVAELAVDVAQARYDRTRSRRAWQRLVDARTAALQVRRVK